MGALVSFLLGAVTGAGITYVLDPDMGRTRRKYAMDKVRGASNSAQDEVTGRLDQATDKLMGTVAEALPESPPPNEQTLVAKVRSEVLGDPRWRDRTINVDAAGGTVTLRGQVDDAEQRDALVEAVDGVTGVDRVESLLHLPGEEPPNIRAPRAASDPGSTA